MTGIGKMLKQLRNQWGLSIRDVAKRSRILADEWGDSAYGFSPNCLWKLEHGTPHLTVLRLVSLSKILSSPPEELLHACMSGSVGIKDEGRFVPNRTVFTKRAGLVHEKATLAVLDKRSETEIPDDTGFLPPDERLEGTSLRLIMIGKKDLALSPMLPPGSILEVDIRLKAILPPRDWQHEFERPIYVLHVRDVGLITGWCEVTDDGTLMVLTHNLSRQKGRTFKHYSDVDIVGRAVWVGKPMKFH